MPEARPSRVYSHAMLQEIAEQPETLRRTLAAYLDTNSPEAKTLARAADLLRQTGSLVVAASGSSRHAGLAAEVLLEDLAGIAVDVEYASEFAARGEHVRQRGNGPRGALMVLSQSGETADTLAALRLANSRGETTIAITNVAGSTMAREATLSLPTFAGVERAIPATKSFTTQLAVLTLLSLAAADPASTDRLQAKLLALPEMLEAQLPAWETSVKAVAHSLKDAHSLMFLGRGVHYAMAREGALKLKESSYVHAEGYPSGELKHGPNALVSPDVPLVVIATQDASDDGSALRYQKTVALLEDLSRQEGARVFALCNEGDGVVPALVEHAVFVTPTLEALLPICEVVPLQLFAYFMALERGVDVDRPRNLVKSVKVE